MNLAHDAGETQHDHGGIGLFADHRGARGQSRPFEIGRDHVAHLLGLGRYHVGQGTLAGMRLVAQHCDGGLEPVGEVADLVARPLDDLGVGAQQFIDLFSQRRNLDGIGARNLGAVPLAHRLHGPAELRDGPQGDSGHEGAHRGQHHADHAEDNEGLSAKIRNQLEDFGEIAGHGDAVALLVERDRALDHAQLRAEGVVGDFGAAAERVRRAAHAWQVDADHRGREIDQGTVLLADDPVPARARPVEARIGQCDVRGLGITGFEQRPGKAFDVKVERLGQRRVEGPGIEVGQQNACGHQGEHQPAGGKPEHGSGDGALAQHVRPLSGRPCWERRA